MRQDTDTMRTENETTGTTGETPATTSTATTPRTPKGGKAKKAGWVLLAFAIGFGAGIGSSMLSGKVKADTPRHGTGIERGTAEGENGCY